MDNQDIHKMLKDLPMDKEIPIATSQKIVNMLENTESFSEKRNNKTYWLLPNIKVLIAFSLCIIIGIPLLVSAIKESGSLSDGSSYEERALLSEFMDLLSDAHYHKKDFRIIKTEINKNDGFVIYLDRFNKGTQGDVYVINRFKKKDKKWQFNGANICSDGWGTSSDIWCGVLNGSEYNKVLIGKDQANPVTEVKTIKINDHLLLWYYESSNPREDLSIKAIRSNGSEVWVKTLSGHQVPEGEEYYPLLKYK